MTASSAADQEIRDGVRRRHGITTRIDALCDALFYADMKEMKLDNMAKPAMAVLMRPRYLPLAQAALSFAGPADSVDDERLIAAAGQASRAMRAMILGISVHNDRITDRPMQRIEGPVVTDLQDASAALTAALTTLDASDATGEMMSYLIKIQFHAASGEESPAVSEDIKAVFTDIVEWTVAARRLLRGEPDA